MQIQDLKPKHARKYKKAPVGRGGKRGTTAGHGTKGQKARAGHRIRPAIRDYIQRLPKLRGYSNTRKSPVSRAVNLVDLKRVSSNQIDLAVLIKAGLAHANETRVKILGDGEIDRAVTIVGIKVSKSAQEKIEKAGGKIAAK